MARRPGGETTVGGKTGPTLFPRFGLVLLLIALLPLAAAVGAQPAGATGATVLAPRTLLFSQLSDRNNPSEAPITAIAQDPQGYLWYSTQEGLKRYDGDDIVTFENRYDDPGSLAGDWVWTLYVDRDGTLWAGMLSGGLDRYDRELDRFTHYRHDPGNLASLSSDSVRVIYQDSEGIHWIGTDGGGLNRLDTDSGVIRRFQHDPEDASSLPDDRVLAIYEDRSGTLWVGTNGGGLSRLNRNTGRFTHYQHDPARGDSLSDNHVRAILEDREGKLWVGTYEGGLNIYDRARNGFRRYRHDPNDPSSLNSDRIRDIHEDSNGTIWVGTDGGLNEWRPDASGFAHYLHDSSDSSSLSDNRVTALYQDRGGVLWVGTYNGLNRWNYLSDAFAYYQSNGTALRLSNNIVTSVAETDSGELWVGTYGGGLNRINPGDASVRYYGSAAGDNRTGGMLNDRVMALYLDDEEQLWISTRRGGLSRLDPDSDRFRHYIHDPAAPGTLSSNNITTMLSAGDGKLWVGTYGAGLNLLDTRSGKAVVYRSRTGDDLGIASDFIVDLYRDRSGNLWVGSEDGGLMRFDEASQSFHPLQHDPENAETISADSAWAIMESSDGALWIGTNGGGLNRWSPEDRAAGRERFSRFRKSDGLRSDAIQGLIEDDDGAIWVSTNRGLVQLDAQGRVLRQFDRNSGLKDSEFNFAAALRSRSGQLHFGGTTGLVSFYPKDIIINLHKPEIVVEAISRQGPMGTRYSVETDDSELLLAYPNDLVTFKFSGLDFAEPGRNRYRYRLIGFDGEWNETREVRRATYTNLPAGNYTFRVQAANNDGIWNERGAYAELRVIPPPWRSPWAYTAYAVLLLALVAAFVRNQSHKLKRETAHRQELEQQVAARTEEIAQRNIELTTLNQKLKESARTDSLTGLKNRRYLDEFIHQEVAMALRRARDMGDATEALHALDIAPALTFMMIDLDGFKKINDQYGHHAGDEALLEVSNIFNRCCRRADTIIRWGGDEFLVIGPNTSNRAAENLAERIRSELSEHQFVVGDGGVARLSASIGFAVYPFSPVKPEIASWEQVSAIADQCAYIAKQNGRNAWVGVYGNRDTRAQDIERMGSDIEGLIEHGRLGLRTSIYHELQFTAKSEAQTSSS